MVPSIGMNSQNEEHELKGDVATSLKVNQRDK